MVNWCHGRGGVRIQLAPAVVSAITGKPIQIDKGEVAIIVIQTAIDLVTMGRRRR